MFVMVQVFIVKMPELVESSAWRVELNPNQQHSGRAFVGLREHKPSLSDLQPDELKEWHRVARALEIGTRVAFGPKVLNWMCLMNNAVRDGQETHVHWHMVPRYDRSVDFNDRTYTDDAYPRQYNTGNDVPHTLLLSRIL